jgi:hypothetical protein
MNENCDFACEMEPDRDAGYCEEPRCSRHSSSPDSSNGAHEFNHRPVKDCSRAFLLIGFQLQAPAPKGESHEKWIKEKSVDISTGSRTEDNGSQENPRRPNCQEVKKDRRSNPAKGLQHGTVARHALTKRSRRLFQLRSPAPRGAFLFSMV